MSQRNRPTRFDDAALPHRRPDAGRFVSDVAPLLESNDLPGLVRLLGRRYDTPQICSLLACDCCDARKCAALALALVGRDDCVAGLVEHLRDDDEMVGEMAEHALWSVWFRGGDAVANRLLVAGCEQANGRDLCAAEAKFTAALERCPQFAEAWNQRAIVRYIREDFAGSIADCRRATDLMPCHFGAWSGMGHCHAHRGEFDLALDSYRRALSINPRLACVAEVVGSMERQLARRAGGLDREGDDALTIAGESDGEGLCGWDDWDEEGWLYDEDDDSPN